MMGHVNNVAYVAWMQDAAMAHSAANGWDQEKYQELGMAWVAREHRIEYLASAFAGDLLHIETWVSGMKRVSSTREYRFVRKTPGEVIAGEVIAVAQTHWAFINLQSFTPAKIPVKLKASFEIVKDANDHSRGLPP